MTTRYAVVDLETTGPKFRRGERIIQIGAVFVENDQIVDRYATFVQPLIPIPKRITQLTGITQRDVANAPLFEDIASDLWQKLQGCTFVGHNVNFDFHFLRDTFLAVGYPKLNLPRIDTVELARVFVPTAESYHLQDICREVGVDLTHAHTANADAEATAELMLTLKARIQKLPAALMHEMTPYLSFLLCETGDYVTKWYADRQEDGQYQGETIAHLTFRQSRAKASEVPQLLAKEPQWNEEQETLITQLAQFYMNDQPFALVTAKAGAGKSLATLYAAMTQRKSEQPIVIVAPTNLLLDQWQTQTVLALAQTLGRSLSTTLLISASHFISLDGFNRLLAIQEHDIAHVSKHEALLTMAVLCWVFETQTGRLEELHRALRVGKFWKKIRVLAEQPNLKPIDWRGHDFYRAQFDTHTQDMIYLTNAAFLVHHMSLFADNGLFDRGVRWLIDECHHLPKIYAEHQKRTLDIESVSQLFHQTEDSLRRMGDAMLYGSEEDSAAPYDQFYETGFALEHLFDSLAYLTDDLSDVLASEPEQFMSAEAFQQAPWHVALSELWVYGRNFRKAFESLLSALSEYQDLYTVRSVKWRRLLVEWQQFEDLMEQLLMVSPEQYISISKCALSDEEAIRIEKCTYPDGQQLKELWEHLPQKTVLISQNLPILANEASPSEWLGISDYQYCEAEAPENYGASTTAYLLSDLLSIEKYSVEERGEMISRVVQQTLQNSRIHKIQVFFHSRALLDQVASLLKAQLDKNAQDVLMTQSEDRPLEQLRVQYKDADRAILLTLDSFQEGIHLDAGTDSYIMTRLPFASPSAVDQQALQYYAKQQGKNYFTDYAMPEMLMLFNQWLGRIFRRDQQPNQVIMLDKRIVSAQYASQIQQYLPADFKFEKITLDELKNPHL